MCQEVYLRLALVSLDKGFRRMVTGAQWYANSQTGGLFAPRRPIRYPGRKA